MKHKYMALIIVGVVALLGLINWIPALGKNNSTEKIELTIDSSKESYLPGEVVNLTISATNKSNESVRLFNDLSPEYGYLSVFISHDNIEYKMYNHVHWGVRDSKLTHIVLKSNERVNTSAAILWNSKPKFDASQLAPETIKAATDGKILTDYAFPESSTYYIKAVYSAYFIDNNQSRTRVKIESEPIQITIKEPTGEDLKIWNKIKDNGEIAYFIQEGSFKAPESEKREKLKMEVEQIINESPDSPISSQMKQSLNKLRANEEKAKLYKEKMSSPD